MYYMVIVQYTARLNPKKLLQTISTLKPESERPPRKRYHFTLAPEQVQFAISAEYTIQHCAPCHCDDYTAVHNYSAAVC
jgi:hypothetical protein